MTRFYVGTAGWSYLGWDREFYPKSVRGGGKLAYYATRFNAVELNASFYRTPSREQVAAWEGQVPAGFRIAIKAARSITHVKKLASPETTLPPFLEAVSGQQKAGPLLFQIPPALALDMDRLAAFLNQLPKGRKAAIELRDASWHRGEVYRLLERHRVAFCLHDTVEAASPRRLTTDFAYVRLRGREGAGLRSFLKDWRDWLRSQTKTAYVFFDNLDEKRLAFGNALAFRELAEDS